MREQQGGFLGALLPVLGKAMALPWLIKAAAPLATGALSGLASWGVNKTLPKSGSGLLSVPQDKVDKLIAYKSYLTKKTKRTNSPSLSDRFRALNPIDSEAARGILGYFAGKHRCSHASQGFKRSGPSSRSNGKQKHKDCLHSTTAERKGKKKRGKGLLLGKNSPFIEVPIIGDIL